MSRALVTRAGVSLFLVALALASIVLGIWLRRHHPPRTPPHVTVVFPNIGDGDCALIRTTEGRIILIDAGGSEAGPAVIAALRQLDAHAIDLLVLAAPDGNSVGGVPAVLAAGYPVALVWDNAVADTGEARRAALEAIRTRHIPSRTAHSGDDIQIGDARTRLSVLWPPEEGPRARVDPLICRLDYGDTAFIFAGAAGGDEGDYLVAGAGDKLNSDVLQLSAQGDDSVTSPEILHSAAPSVAVIACRAETPPSAGTLHRLQAAGAEVWRTDTQGTITVMTDGHFPPVVLPSRM